MMLNLFDSHTHSDNSPDGEHSVTFMCEKAVANGLMGFALTDHCDIDTYQEDSFQLRMIQSVFEARKAQLSFGQRINLTVGIELGQPLSDELVARAALESHNYDFVLGSVHAIRGQPDFYYLNAADMAPEQVDSLLTRYFDEVLETVRRFPFDVLAHLTYPLRYITGRDGVPVDLKRYAEQIDAVLHALVKSGRGLELNVSGLYGSYGRPMPPRDILKRYREIGGEIVTLGSDAHRAENIGRGIEDGMQLLRECGYRYFAFYKKRAPRMLELR